MTKQKLHLAKENPQDFSLHLPNKVLTDKDIESRFKNLKDLLRKFQNQSSTTK